MATTAAAPEGGNFARRDLLLSIQSQVQKMWEEEKVFEANAPAGESGEGEEARPKFFGNFPYPYMNGMLHLGHAFSLSKVGG
ncbi:putative leucine--tRNA ligase, cytoplasmic [Tetrabaena socialis]|uniref:Putative leucine--tRNA ligase, cytoplasmic n=1 Tax=Tetrabaena socialis TaxID=47790 RepID=A0A2J7ZR65_9CHLO|nr:putative leucine--tRNA ligase, cytoplasmic [Tetrabaena socialis]|eukprot:PNH02764.1 putative leucine--tRNA ligase, cytoplasmic [Tetrabaena socialis]